MVDRVLAFPREALKFPQEIQARCFGDMWHLISISSSRSECPDREFLRNFKKYGCGSWMTIWFSDLTTDGFEEIKREYPSVKLFATKEARKIIKFVEVLKSRPSPHGDTIIVHCDAGVSRSGAVADFLCDYLDLDRDKFEMDNRCIFPNQHVLRVLRRVAVDYYECEKWY